MKRGKHKKFYPRSKIGDVYIEREGYMMHLVLDCKGRKNSILWIHMKNGQAGVTFISEATYSKRWWSCLQGAVRNSTWANEDTET